MRENPRRRRLLQTLAGGSLAALAGCLGGDDGSDDDNNDSDADDDQPQRPEAIEGENIPRNPIVEDPPDVVYKPTHVPSVVMLDTVEVGEYTLLPHLTFPHDFWLVRGAELEPVEPRGNELHFMIAFWDSETGAMLPVDAGQTLTVRRDGEIVEPQFQPWPMISQRMGFHFGDNVPFPGEGSYTLEVGMGPIDTRKTGAFAGRFGERATATFEFEYTQQLVTQAVSNVEYLPESEWGEPGAIEPMGSNMGGMDGMDGPMSEYPGVALPAASSYPGRDLGVHESHDAHFVVRHVEQSRLADGEGYLLVSARTPYNRVPLPDMALSVEGAVEGDLVQTLDSEIGHHYGLPANLASGDSFDLVVESPPQAARHQGYETAFLEMEPMTVSME